MLRDLAEIQMHFQQFLLQQTSDITSEIIDSPTVSASERLDIYRDAYYLRLLEVLEQDYPMLHVFMGCDAFDRLVQDYIIAYPSPYRSARWVGKHVASFMRESNRYSQQPWLISMAEFEWALLEAFDAEDSDIITVDTMAAIPVEQWPTLRFSLHASVRRLNFQWEMISIWHAIQEGRVPDIVEETTRCLIWRKELEVDCCALSVDEAYMLDAMAAGEDFASICEGLCEWIEPEHVAMYAAQLLKRFILDGVVRAQDDKK